MRRRPRPPTRLSIGPDESIIPTVELDDLRRRAEAHDTYLDAYRAMTRRADLVRKAGPGTGPAGFRAGWLACFREWQEAILRTARNTTRRT